MTFLRKFKGLKETKEERVFEVICHEKKHFCRRPLFGPTRRLSM